MRPIFDVARNVDVQPEICGNSGLVHSHLLEVSSRGALTQIFEEFKPENVPVLIGDVVTEIDRMVIEVSSPGWEIKDDGKREVRKGLLKVFKKFRLPLTGEPFDCAYRYIETHY